MKKIADTNFIQNEFLVREYLSRSPKNQIALTDYVAMELYNSGNIETLRKATRALAPHLGRVFVLKDIRRACGLSGRKAGLQRRFIDDKQTAELPIFFREVEDAFSKNEPYLNRYKSMAASAADQLNAVLIAVSENSAAYSDFANRFTKEELLSIRKQTGISKTVIDKIFAFIFELSYEVFRQHPASRRLANMQEIHNTYIFRASLANTVLALWWVGVGGAENAKPETHRNDAVDCYLVSYASFFDGVLSGDKKLNDIHATCRYILSEAFKC